MFKSVEALLALRGKKTGLKNSKEVHPMFCTGGGLGKSSSIKKIVAD
jgi:hypothetical protein